MAMTYQSQLAKEASACTFDYRHVPSAKLRGLRLLSYGTEALPKGIIQNPPSASTYDAFRSGVPIKEIYGGRLASTSTSNPLSIAVGLLEYAHSYDAAEDIEYLLSVDTVNRNLWVSNNMEPCIPFLPSRYNRSSIVLDSRLAWPVAKAWNSVGWYLPHNGVQANLSHLCATDLKSIARVHYCRRDEESKELLASAAETILSRTHSGLSKEEQYIACRLLTRESFQRMKDRIYRLVPLGVRADSTAEEMGVALKEATTLKHPSIFLTYLGRPLTYEDAEAAGWKATLNALENAPVDAVHGISLDKRVLALLSEADQRSLSKIAVVVPGIRDKRPGAINKRTAAVFDTAENNYDYYGFTEDTKNAWKGFMRPFITQYCEARFWRDELLRLADPDTAYLALLSNQAAAVPDKLSVGAKAMLFKIDTFLRSVPNVQELMAHVNETPAHALRLT